MADFVTKFLPSTKSIIEEIKYLQCGNLALNAETPKSLTNDKLFVEYIIDSNLPCDWTYAGPDIRDNSKLLRRLSLHNAYS